MNAGREFHLIEIDEQPDWYIEQFSSSGVVPYELVESPELLSPRPARMPRPGRQTEEVPRAQSLCT